MAENWKFAEKSNSDNQQNTYCIQQKTKHKNIKKKEYRKQKGKEGTFTREKEKKPDNTKGKEDSLVVKIRGFGT